MKRWDPDMWSAVYGTAICAAVGLPLLVINVRGEELTSIPVALWWTCFAGYLLAQTVCTWWSDRLGPRAVRAGFGAMVVLGTVLALSAPRAGWTSILLIFTSALSVYVVRMPVTVAVIVCNTAVIVLASVLGDLSAGAVVATGALYLLLQVASVAGVVATARAQRNAERLAVAHTELRAAHALLAESSRADERLRIARELHDALGHQLTVLALELETASHKADPAEHVVRAKRVARELLADVRATVGELRHRAPDLRATLDRIVADLPAPQVQVHVDAGVQTDEARTAVLIRCVQEVVTNAIRHARADFVWIEIRIGDEGGIVFDARDDGRGADRVVMGHGLTGIDERVRELGGQARFEGRPGFRVVAEVPAP
jgi:signal transduction histidine kinase